MPKFTRHYTPLDRFCRTLQSFLKPLATPVSGENPSDNTPEGQLTPSEKQHAASLMRVNHSGEVCAQALYRGQAAFTGNKAIAAELEESAVEEAAHLAWTAQRVKELGSKTSILNPLWYTGAFAMGAVSALMGDKWNLGFLAETEHQVGKHLANHLTKLPLKDAKSQKIIIKMQQDEATHEHKAIDLGAATLPTPVKGFMKITSKLMTTTSYYL